MSQITINGALPAGSSVQPGSISLPQVGASDSTEEPKIPIDLAAIADFLNVNNPLVGIGGGNLLPAFLGALVQTSTVPASGKVWKLNFGVWSFTSPDNTHCSWDSTIPHGLGATPLVWWVQSGIHTDTNVGWGGTHHPTQPADATNLYVTSRAYTTAGGSLTAGTNIVLSAFSAGVPYELYWYAIGAVTAPNS